MEIKNNVVLNFYLNSETQAEFLKCFLSYNELILFHCHESYFYPNEENWCISNKEKEFIKNRTIVVSNEYIIYWLPDDGKNIYWYSPKDTNELVNIIKDNYYDYICIILENGKEIKDYTYLLSIEENYPVSEDDTCHTLIVNERVRDSFKNNVVPKIKEKFIVNIL